MLNKFVIKMADHQNPNSFATKFRKQRFLLFKSLVQTLPFPLKILDVGGRETIWQREGFCNQNMIDQVEIIILNQETIKVTHPNVKAVIGDARNMKQFETGEFDIVFSNSVIEHIGNYNDQQQMAKEIKRVGKKYFLQTPNRYFPIEPHFLFPFFQFLPLSVKVWLINHFTLGWRRKVTDKKKATTLVSFVRLLNKKELLDLFFLMQLLMKKNFGYN